MNTDFSPVVSDRSTPCPSVKHGDEWGEPSKCESGDSCQYCHSRTEQQFHPEVSELKLLSAYSHNEVFSVRKVSVSAKIRSSSSIRSSRLLSSSLRLSQPFVKHFIHTI